MKLKLTDIESSPKLMRSPSTPVPMLPTCEVDGCNLLAIGGVCEYKICFSSGCGKQLCKEHTAIMEPDEVGLQNKVCTNCKSSASRIQIYWLIAIIAIPMLLSLPAIFLYSMSTEQVWAIGSGLRTIKWTSPYSSLHVLLLVKEHASHNCLKYKSGP